MKKILDKITNCNCIPAVLTFTALIILVVQMIGIIAKISNIIPDRPGEAAVVFIAATVAALIQPCLLLGVARIITIMQNRTPNA